MGRKIVVGMLLLGALIIFALATFYIENWERYLKKGYEIKCRFETAHALQVGDEVRIAGVEVGRVDSLWVETEKPTDRPVEALLWIRPDVRIRAKDVAHIETRSVFGGSFISISREDPDAPVLKDGDELENTHVRPSITELIARADTALEDASSVFANTQGTLAKAGDAFDEARQTIRDVREITDRINQGEGFLGKLLTEDKGYDELLATIDSAKSAFERINQLATDLREGEGFIPKLIRDEGSYEKLQGTMDSAKNAFERIDQLATDLREGEGSIPKLIRDKESYEKLQQTMDSARNAFEGIERLSQDMHEGKGVMPKLITDEELAKKVEEIATDTKTLTGKLVAAMENVQQLVDDYREQSPVLTFMGAFFGAF